MSYFENNEGKKYTIFGDGGGDNLAKQFGLDVLAKIPSVKILIVMPIVVLLYCCKKR